MGVWPLGLRQQRAVHVEVPAGLEQDFVSLDRLRALGIRVRYDAINDRLVVDPPA